MTKDTIKISNKTTRKTTRAKKTKKELTDHKAKLIECFSILIQYADAVKNKNAHFKKRSFNKIIGNLTSYEGRITSAEQVEEIFKAAGMKNPTKTMIKINQYFTTGTMEDVEKAKSNPQVTALQNLTKIYAIKPSKAIELHTKLELLQSMN